MHQCHPKVNLNFLIDTMVKKKALIQWKTLRKAAVGKVDVQEQQELDNWLNDSDKNRLYFEKARKFYALENDENEVEEGSALAWQEFHRRIQVSKRIVWAKWSVAASVAILALAGYYLLSDIYKGPEIAQVPEILSKNGDVTLTLADGDEIIISPTDSFILNKYDNKITALKGEVNYYNEEISVVDPEFHTVTVPASSTYNIVLSDSSIVHLNANTKIHYPVLFAGDTREVRIEGEAYFEVKKGNRPFIVHAGGNAIQVLGTQFNVNTYHYPEDVRTTLVSGKVQVETESRESAILNPGQQAICLANGNIAVENVDLSLVVDWHHNLFVYKHESLGVIMDELAQWYDIEVVYSEAAFRDLQFTGSLQRDESITKLLGYFEKTKKVAFEIKGNKIYVRKY